VFDAEDELEEKKRGYRDTLQKLSKSSVNAANSSPCFEYWILLHFVIGIKVYSPSEALRELKRKGRIPNYEKPYLPFNELWTIYKNGKPSTAACAAREEIEISGQNPIFGRPVTYVDKLLDRLSEIDAM
jgi:hypothetical protein